MDSIYKSTSFGFKVCYYMSSLLPQYCILLLAFVSENFETKFPPNICAFTLKKCIFCALFVIFLVDLWCLWRVGKDIDNVSDHENILGKYNVKLSYRINPGIGEFFLNILVPIILALPSINLSLNSFIIIISIQIVTYFFYSSSTDIFPNLSLWIINYNVYKIQSSNNFNKGAYILGKSNRSKTEYNGKRVSVVPLIAQNPESKFAVINHVINGRNKR